MATFSDRLLVVVSASTAGAVTELDKVTKSSKGADTAAGNLGKTLKAGLKAGLAVAAGAGLVAYLNESVEAFGDAAKAAGELANATGGSVEEISRMQAALEASGISAEESAGLITKFTVQAGKNSDLLDRLGVSVKKNADGSTDYADAMVQAIDGINKMGDASARNQALVDLFGKKGAQAFQELAASGVSLSDAMAAVSKYQVFDADDIAKAARYDDAMDSLQASTRGLQFALGSYLIPVISATAEAFTTVVDAGSDVVDFLSHIPTPILVAVGAFTALKVAMESTLVVGLIKDAALAYETLAAGITLAGGASVFAEGAIRALTYSLLANPITAVAVAIAAVATLAFTSAQRRRDELKTMVGEVKQLEAEGKTHAAAIEEVARKSEAAQVKGRKKVEGGFQGKELRDEIAALNKAYDEEQQNLTAVAAAQSEAAQSQEELTTRILEGSSSTEELAANVKSAADAQKKSSDATDTAKGLMEAYAAATWDAVDATESMFDAQHKMESSQRNLADAVKSYNEERSADNAADVVDAMWDLADASTAAWEAEEKRYGRYPTQEQQDAHKIQALKDALGQIPNGTAAAEKAGEEYARAMAAWAAAHPTTIPVGYTVEDVDTAIANIQGQLDDPNITAQAKVDLQTDLTNLTTLKANIASGAATTVPVTVTTTPGSVEGVQTQIDGLTTSTTTNVTVNTSFEPGGYNAVKARKDYLAQAVNAPLGINVTFSPDGYNALKARKDYLAQNRTAYIDVVVRGASSARRQLDSLGSTASSTAAAAGVSVQVPPAINMVRVSVDGRELRAVVRDELRGLQPTVQAVA